MEFKRMKMCEWRWVLLVAVCRVQHRDQAETPAFFVSNRLELWDFDGMGVELTASTWIPNLKFKLGIPVNVNSINRFASYSHNLATIQCYFRFQHGNGTITDGSALLKTETSLSIFPVPLLVSLLSNPQSSGPIDIIKRKASKKSNI